MVALGVAGEGAGIGLDIVQTILSTRKHEVIILSRSDQPNTYLQRHRTSG